MSLLTRLFNYIDPPKPRPKKQKPVSSETPAEETPAVGPPLDGIRHIQFGHFSDTNRTPEIQALRGDAEALFAQKKYYDSLLTLMRYLRNDTEDALQWQADEPNGSFTFQMQQGTRLITGQFDGQYLHASVPLARAEQPGTAVMRRLLELNYELRYTSVGMDTDGTFYLVFDTDAATASPTKVYKGLEELAIKADRQDDSLRTDFTELLPVPSAPVTLLPEEELSVKYRYMQQWIAEALKLADTFDADAYAGALSNIYLTTVYRLDFLLSPDGPLMLELERISGLYWKQKDTKALVLRNAELRAALEALKGRTQEEITCCMHRTRSTFALTDNPRMDRAKDNINAALRDAATYQGRRQTELALYLVEFGLVYNQYLFSLPDVLRDLTLVQSAVLHPGFFRELGLKEPLYNAETDKPEEARIKAVVRSIIAPWRKTFLNLQIDFTKIDFSSRYTFCNTYAAQIAQVQI